MTSTRPAAVRWIVGLNRIRIAIALLAIGAAIYFVSPSESEGVEAFRRGWVKSTGVSVEDYGPEQAGQVAGAASVPAILSSLMLLFVRRRKLRALRITAAVNFILGWSQPMMLPLALTTLILASRQSTRDYLEGTARPQRPSAAPVRAPRRPAITHP